MDSSSPQSSQPADNAKPAEGAKVIRRTGGVPKRSAAPALTRGAFLKRLPLHLLLAAFFGAATAVLLALLGSIQLEGRWHYIMLFPLGALYVNGVVLPVAIPGRHWSFSFLCSMMLVLICLAAGIISTWIHLPHSTINGVYLEKINVLTFLAIVTGASIGLFYGILVGQPRALGFGALMGAVAGYLLGIGSTALISHETETLGQFIYNTLGDYAWQGAAGLTALHLFAAVGALMGAGSEPERS